MIGNRISERVAHAGSRIRSVRVATATLTVGAVTALAIALPVGTAVAAPHNSGPGAHSPTRTAKLLDVRRPADRKRVIPRTDRLPTRQEIEAIAVPLDRELAGVVRMLKAAGIDQMALQAAQVIFASRGQLTVESLNAAVMSVYNSIGKTRTGYADRPDGRPVQSSRSTKPVREAGAPRRRTSSPNAALRTFTPKSSPICTRSTSDNPLGLTTPVGQLSGRWPVTEAPADQVGVQRSALPRLVLPAAIDRKLIPTGEVAFALIPPAPEKAAPAGKQATKPGPPQKAGTTQKAGAKKAASAKAPAAAPLRIAWLNTTTLQGGFADLDTDASTRSWLRKLAGSHGLRLAPVKSRYGTELAVVSRESGDERGCSFVPAISLAGV